MKITVLGKEMEKPINIFEMINALILKAKENTLSCCARFPPQLKDIVQKKTCEYRKDGNACFIGQFLDDGIGGLDYFASIEDMIGDEDLSWSEYFKDFNRQTLMDLQSIHDDIPDEMAKEDPSIQSKHYLEKLIEFKEELKSVL